MSYATSAASNAARAYQAGAAHRSLRDQEADVFRRAAYVLRSSGQQGPMAQVRALAENRRLWSLVQDLVRDPDNRLPLPIRANLVSISLAVGRELDKEQPDLAFLAEVNEHIAAGLSGH